MAAQWTPPTDGTPCWINVLATDVPRAKKFYESVFKWKFPEKCESQDDQYSPDKIAMFEAPGQPCPGGGITLVEPKDEFVRGRGKSGVVLYLYVDGLDGWEQKIINAGGKKGTGVEPQGASASMQHFEDTEGNWFGLYSMNK